MSSIVVPGPNLPPGLLLPLPEEDTERFLTRNFVRPDLTEEEIIDYGIFVVALAAYAAEETGRVSLMPTSKDFAELHDAGYGLGVRTMSRYGFRWLQESLGFFPDGVDAPVDAIEARLKWIVHHAYPEQHGDDAVADLVFEDLLFWGAARDLLPGRNSTRRSLNGNTVEIRRELGLERRLMPGSVTKMDLWKFGQEILHDYGEPLGGAALNRAGEKMFPSEPYEVIRWCFGSLTNFWLEYGKVHNAKGLSADELVDLGVQWNIRHGETIFTPSVLTKLSAEKRFVSKMPIVNQFHTIPNYRDKVAERLESYYELREELVEAGVSEPVIRAMCLRFRDSAAFKEQLREHTDLLIRLSAEEAEYVLQIIEKGFNLIDPDIFDYQRRDFKSALRKVGISKRSEWRWILEYVPQFEVAEGIKLVGR